MNSVDITAPHEKDTLHLLLSFAKWRIETRYNSKQVFLHEQAHNSEIFTASKQRIISSVNGQISYQSRAEVFPIINRHFPLWNVSNRSCVRSTGETTNVAFRHLKLQPSADMSKRHRVTKIFTDLRNLGILASHFSQLRVASANFSFRWDTDFSSQFLNEAACSFV